MKCYCCGKDGHTSNKCPVRDKIPRKEWSVNKAVSSMQTKEPKIDAEKTTEEENTEGWCGLQHCQATAKTIAENPFKHLKEVIVLDTGSMIPATFNNKDFVANIQEANLQYTH